MYVLVLCLIVAALAVARLSMLFTQDQLTIRIRQAVVQRFGDNSLPSYLIHCDWCLSMWIAIPVMLVAVTYPNRWVIGVLAVPAASLVAGFLSKLRG